MKTSTSVSAPPAAKSAWPRAAGRSITWSSTMIWNAPWAKSSTSSRTNGPAAFSQPIVIAPQKEIRRDDRGTQERRDREQGGRPLQADRVDPEAHARADGRRPPAGRARRHDRPGGRDPGNPSGQDRHRLRAKRPGSSGVTPVRVAITLTCQAAIQGAVFLARENTGFAESAVGEVMMRFIWLILCALGVASEPR